MLRVLLVIVFLAAPFVVITRHVENVPFLSEERSEQDADYTEEPPTLYSYPDELMIFPDVFCEVAALFSPAG